MTALLELYGATTHRDLVRWVRDTYGIGVGGISVNPHRLRREEIAQRVRLYRDDGRSDMEALINRVFDDAEVKKQRITMIEVASEQNVTRRIVDEVASLYDKPAVRKLKSRDQEFHAEEKRLNLHEVMQEAHRLLQLCNEVLLWQFLGVDNKTKLRVVTPDTFDALPDPRDATAMAGVLIDAAPITIAPNKDRLPHYELWDDTFRYLLNAAGELVDAAGNPAEEPIKHGLGRIPAVLLHKRQPGDRLLDSRPGRDITSAHKGVGLLHVMMMRLAKSQGEQQPVLKGPLANVAKNQRMDGETPFALPPEVEAEMLDSVTTPDHFISLLRVKVAGVASTYGMSYEYVVYGTADSASGAVWQMRRQKLIELRGEQARRGKLNEAEVITLLGFDPEGMAIDYQEQAIPQDASEEVDLLEKKMKKGLDSPVKYIMRKNPDLSRAEALIEMRENLADWELLVEVARRMNMRKGADAAAPGGTPQQNGGGERPPPNDPGELEDDGALQDAA